MLFLGYIQQDRGIQRMETEKINIGIYRGIQLCFGTLFCIFVVVVVLYQYTEFQSVLHNTLININWFQLTMGWLLMVLAIFVLGFRWKVLLKTTGDLTGGFLGACLAAGLLLNYAIPGPFGELVGSYFVHRKSGIPISHAVAAAVVSRIIGLLTAAIGACICYLYLSPMQLAPRIIQILMLGIIGGIGALFLILLLPKKLNHVKHRTIASLVTASASISNLPTLSTPRRETMR